MHFHHVYNYYIITRKQITWRKFKIWKKLISRKYIKIIAEILKLNYDWENTAVNGNDIALPYWLIIYYVFDLNEIGLYLELLYLILNLYDFWND